MTSGISTFTAIKLDDKDINDENSGFYTTQATTEQINSIPTNAKAEGELLYNKTTGKLVVYNGIAGGWETLNSSDGLLSSPAGASFSMASAANFPIQSYTDDTPIPIIPNPVGISIIKQDNFSIAENNKAVVRYLGNNNLSVIVTATMVVEFENDVTNNLIFGLKVRGNYIGFYNTQVTILTGSVYHLTLTGPVILHNNDTVSLTLRNGDRKSVV